MSQKTELALRVSEMSASPPDISLPSDTLVHNHEGVHITPQGSTLAVELELLNGPGTTAPGISGSRVLKCAEGG